MLFGLACCAMVACESDEENDIMENPGNNTDTSKSEGKAIDIGLDFLIADRNIGASKVSDPGLNFAWGEVETKENFELQNYFDSTYTLITSNIHGTQYDAATVRWGDEWRMISNDEIRIIEDSCRLGLATVDGAVCLKITGPNDNFVYIPYTYDNYGYYNTRLWTGDIMGNPANRPKNSGAYCIFLENKAIDGAQITSQYGMSREQGLYIRAVQSKKHDWVDLGLSVKWATCNIGAESPEEIGYSYAWAEVDPKREYTWNNYRWCYYNETKISKYCINATNSVSTRPDNKSTIEPYDDVATYKWGKKWRMPLKEEFDELIDCCEWKWTAQNGVKGYLVTGPNGNSIFLPTTEGNSSRYWSSSLSGDNRAAYALSISYGYNGMVAMKRFLNMLIRPVTMANE